MNDVYIRLNDLLQLVKKNAPFLYHMIAPIALLAEPVQIVRCKDCKHSGMYCFGASHEPSFACLDIEEDGFVRFAAAADPEGYCSHAERRTE